MNRAEIEQLATAVSALRPDWRWDSLVTFLTKHAAHRPLWDAARALVWIALEPGHDAGTFDHETPRLFTEPGPWWSQQVVVDPKTAHTPTPIGWCSLHGCEDSRNNPCRACIDARSNALRDPDVIARIRAEYATKPAEQENPE